MRDLLVLAIVVLCALAALRRPWIGVLLWVWISLMNPHRYTFGFAYDAPVAMMAALATFVGMLASAEKQSPFQGTPAAIFALLTLWITLSWLMGLSPGEEYPQWNKVMKVNVMVLAALMLIKSKEQIFCLTWVMTLSIALLSAKGGLFTILNGGSARVWGPPGSFVEGNNEFAVATIMAIPLLRFMQLQVTSKHWKRVIALGMLLCAASALGSQSRGGLLAILAMSTVLWWRGQNKFRNAIFFVVLGFIMLGFMPDTWTQRMDTIETYEEDNSALGRFSAWWTSWGVGLHYLFGIGFNISRPELFLAYSPYQMNHGTPVAHSIFFQMIGHHGFIGFVIFMALWVSTILLAQKLMRFGDDNPQHRWCRDLGAMSQVSLVGYLAGGAFLQLGYYDFPYYVMAIVVLTHAWTRRMAWQAEPDTASGWRAKMGLAPVARVPVAATAVGRQAAPRTVRR